MSFHKACYTKDLQMLKSLLKGNSGGINQRAFIPKSNGHLAPKYSPLSICCLDEVRWADGAVELLKHPNINPKVGGRDSPPILHCVGSKRSPVEQIRIVKAIVRHPKTDVNAPWTEYTVRFKIYPIQYAVTLDLVEVVVCLLCHPSIHLKSFSQKKPNMWQPEISVKTERMRKVLEEYNKNPSMFRKKYDEFVDGDCQSLEEFHKKLIHKSEKKIQRPLTVENNTLFLFLKEINLEMYDKNLRNIGLSYNDLPHLVGDDVKEVLTKPFQRRKFFEHVTKHYNERMFDQKESFRPEKVQSTVVSMEKKQQENIKRLTVKMSDLSPRITWEIIGAGGFGSVFLAKYRGAPVAVKVIAGQRKAKESQLSEIEKLMMLSFPFVIQVYGFCLSKSRKEVFIVLELMDMNAVEFCEDASLWRKLKLMADMCMSIDYLHSKSEVKHRIIHGDIKGSNFLVSKDGKQVKISDFGLSRVKEHSTTFSTSVQASGTYTYFSPELMTSIQGAKYSIYSDIYALGITFYELLFNVSPFYNQGIKCESDMRIKLMSKNYYPVFLKEDKDEFIPKVPMEIYDDILVKMWKRNPEDRLPLKKVVELLKKKMVLTQI